MKRLTLIRHAKSDWSAANLNDFDRPLNGRGKKAAPMMGARMVQRGSVPELLVSSPAQRAERTARLLAKELALPKAATTCREVIYEASLTTLIELVRELPELNHIALIGHNPGLTELGHWLCDQAPDWLPTCGVLELEIAIDQWRNLDRGQADLLCYDYPKKHSQP